MTMKAPSNSSSVLRIREFEKFGWGTWLFAGNTGYLLIGCQMRVARSILYIEYPIMPRIL